MSVRFGMAIRSYFEMIHFCCENENTDFIEFIFLESINVYGKNTLHDDTTIDVYKISFSLFCGFSACESIFKRKALKK